MPPGAVLGPHQAEVPARAARFDVEHSRALQQTQFQAGLGVPRLLRSRTGRSAEHQAQGLFAAADVELALQFALGGRMQHLAHRHTRDLVGQCRPALVAADRDEAGLARIQRSTTHFLRTRRRLTGVGEGGLVADLPARINSVGQPDLADRFRQILLAVLGLLAGDVVRARGEGVGGHRRLAGFALPDAGKAEQVGVEAGPEVVAEVEDEAARRQVFFRQALAGLTGVEHAAEERKVRFHEVAPGRRRRLLGGDGLQAEDEGEKGAGAHQQRTGRNARVCQPVRGLRLRRRCARRACARWGRVHP